MFNKPTSEVAAKFSSNPAAESDAIATSRLITVIKSFITLGPKPDVIKLFLSVIYEFS
jgi:hypothetical protein